MYLLRGEEGERSRPQSRPSRRNGGGEYLFGGDGRTWGGGEADRRYGRGGSESRGGGGEGERKKSSALLRPGRAAGALARGAGEYGRGGGEYDRGGGEGSSGREGE